METIQGKKTMKLIFMLHSLDAVSVTDCKEVAIKKYSPVLGKYCFSVNIMKSDPFYGLISGSYDKGSSHDGTYMPYELKKL